MHSVNMLEAKSSLSRLVDALERGVESEIVIARNGKPAARLVPIEPPAGGPRLGVAKGMFTLPENIDADNPAVASLFSGEDG
jgi:antitoxin (DNA-binding transcriptional repressor) of toxin-antitoxin stability system